MSGVIAQVSDSIRDNGGIGEIIFSQTGARRSTAARSEDGTPIQRGTEVVVIRYERGVAYVRRFDDFSTSLTARDSQHLRSLTTLAASLAEALPRHPPTAASTSHALQVRTDKGTICRTPSPSLLV